MSICTTIFNCFFLHYRQDAAKRQTAAIVFTHRPKIRFFAPQGRLVAPIHVRLCSTDGHLGPLGCAKFHVNHPRGMGMRPQNIKNFHFLVKSRPAGATPLTDFEFFLGAFIRLTILRQRFKFHVIRFTGYEVIAEKPRVGKLGQIFPCTLQEKLYVGSKNERHFF